MPLAGGGLVTLARMAGIWGRMTLVSNETKSVKLVAQADLEQSLAA